MTPPHYGRKGPHSSIHSSMKRFVLLVITAVALFAVNPQSAHSEVEPKVNWCGAHAPVPGRFYCGLVLPGQWKSSPLRGGLFNSRALPDAHGSTVYNYTVQVRDSNGTVLSSVTSNASVGAIAVGNYLNGRAYCSNSGTVNNWLDCGHLYYG